MEKIIIVGAGLSGATMARLFADSGDDVTVIDKRMTLGGNAYDYMDKNGILVQLYGPHIFHTSDKTVFDFLSKYTEWTKYEHKVVAKIKKKFVPVPFNMTSLFMLYPQEKAERISKVLIDEIGMNKKVPILTLKKHANPEVREFADFVYKNIFYTYTKKQWGFAPEELGESVMNRVPVYISEEDRYFTDKYQYMPKEGFTYMVENMLRHPRIKLKLGKDAMKSLRLREGRIFMNGKVFNGTLIYTGCVDELFEYKFGVLPYRSLKFKFKTLNTPSYQPAAVVNYTTSKRYTRISEFTKFACPKAEKTVIVKEYPKEYVYTKKSDVPYYPIPLERNIGHYNEYLKESQKYKNLYLLGRLANYKYVNMDVAVKNAIELFEKIKED